MANDTQTRRAPVKRAAAAKTAKAAPAKKATAPKKATVGPKKTPAKATPKAAAPPLPPAGWYLNPADQTEQRYWDGEGYVGDPISADLDATDLPAPTAEANADAAATANAPKGTIVFRGRTMAVKRPTPEQLAVWKRIADRATGIGQETSTAKPCPECNGDGCETCHNTGSAHTAAVLKLFDRALKIIASVLVSEDDRDWVEDELLEGKVDLNGAAEIVSLAVGQMAKERGGKAAPKTGPAATRRPRKR